MISYSGVVYRVLGPKWAPFPTSGEGARLHGGRFNPVGLPALYTALSYETAMSEFRQGTAPLFPPCTVVSIEVNYVANLADLRTDALRDTLGVQVADLECAWALDHATGKYPKSWALADRLVANGYAGMLVPSFAPGVADGTNLVLWQFGDDPPCQVKVHDPDGALPKDQSSWSASA